MSPTAARPTAARPSATAPSATAPSATAPRAEGAFLRFESGSGGLVHLPALDGLRGLAVVAVVAFHGNWSFARGGFLGVSLFFTLSGFLITSLLISERRRRNHVDLLAFWGRRFRRLLPAAWLTLAAVTVAAVALGEFSSATRLDIWASLANVANWRFWAGGSSYNALFERGSPVLHFWSLAIEEQCYLVVPLIVGIVLHRARRPLRTLAFVLGGLLAASVVVTVMVTDPDRIYYGTDTRAAELLIGALLAVAVAHEPLRRRVALRLVPRGAVQVAGGVALVATVLAWATVAVSDPFVSDGGLLAVGMASAAMVLSGALGVGPVAAVLRLAPLRFLGRISYGVYLYHWPLFVFLTERRTGLGHGPRFVLQVILTLALASASHRWFEQPLRRAPLRLGPLTAGRLVPLVAVLLVVVTLGMGVSSTTDQSGFDADRAVSGLRQLNRKMSASPVEAGTNPSVAADESGPVSTTAPRAAPTLAIFGDSVALSIAYPTSGWATRTGLITFVGGDAELGCGIGRGGRQRAFGDVARTAECDAWPQRWQAFVAERHPDIAMVQSAQWELVDRKLPGDTTWRHAGDPVYDNYLRGEFLAATDVLAADGALVVWVTVPSYSRLDDDNLPAPMRASHDQVRVDALNGIIRDVAAERPSTVRILDLASWMADKVDDVTLRHDGSHFNDTGAERLAADFVGPELVRLWDDWRQGREDVGGG